MTDSTYAAYFYRANSIKQNMGEFKIREVDKVKIEDYLDYLFVEKKYQPQTVKDIKVFFSSLMEHAVKDQIIRSNPVADVKKKQKSFGKKCQIKKCRKRVLFS